VIGFELATKMRQIIGRDAVSTKDYVVLFVCWVAGRLEAGSVLQDGGRRAGRAVGAVRVLRSSSSSPGGSMCRVELSVYR
jgi:hypothetical protein